MSDINIKKLEEIQKIITKIDPLKVYDMECKSLPHMYYILAKKVNEIIKNSYELEIKDNKLANEIINMRDYFEDVIFDEVAQIIDNMRDTGVLEEILSEINRVIFMPVNRTLESGTAGGDCSVVVSSKGKVVMIDTGANHSYALIKEELQKQNIQKIDYVIISHYHADHTQNLEMLQTDFYMNDTVYYLPKHSAMHQYNDDYVLERIGVNDKIYPDNGDILEVDNLKFTFLNCGEDDIIYYDQNTINYNDYSMCCYCDNGAFSIFFSGDIHHVAQGRLMELGVIREVDVLKIEHHGADGTVNNDYLRVLNPKVGVVSDGEYKYLKENILCSCVRLLQCMGSKIYCTGKGTVEYKFNMVSENITRGYEVQAVFKDMRDYNIIYLDKNYTGISDGSYYKPYRSLREALAKAYEMTPSPVNIKTKDDSLFETDEHIRIVNLPIQLKLSNMKIRQVHIINSKVMLENIEIYDDDQRTLYIDQSDVTLNNVTISGTYDGRGVAIYTSQVNATTLNINNRTDALCVYNASIVHIEALGGTGVGTAVVAGGGCYVAIKSRPISCTTPCLSDRASTIKGAITALDGYLQEGDDLNNYKDYGRRYIAKTGAITISLLNAPEGIGYSIVLETTKATDDGSIYQVIKSRHLMGNDQTGIWVRTYNTIDGFSAWFKLL